MAVSIEALSRLMIFFLGRVINFYFDDGMLF